MTNLFTNNYFIGFLFVYLCGYKSIIVIGEIFTLGYLTGSQRRAGNLEYAKPGKWHFIMCVPSRKLNSRLNCMWPIWIDLKWTKCLE